MGQILTQFLHERRTLPQLQFFADKSLSKIQQYYCIYKNISDTFAIDDTQFKDIFGDLHPVFEVLDTNSSLLIDGLQLFTAMPLFSKLISLEDKIQFIFKLFDFNDLKSLSCNDIQFMILTCCTVTHKLLGIKSQLREDIVLNFTGEEFGSIQKRINISQVKKWALCSQIVAKFIQVINNEEEPQIKVQQKAEKMNTLLSQKLYRSYYVCSRNQLGSLLTANSKSLTYKKAMQKQTRKWLIENRKLIDVQNLNTNTNKLSLRQSSNKDQSDVIISPSWIYGIRYKDVKYFIQFANENEVIYFIGKVVILYNLKSQKQRHYFEHDQPVICLASNKNVKNLESNQFMIASSEIVSNDELIEQLPAIRVWNPFTLKTFAVIRGQHKVGVHLLNFTTSGGFLISCGLVFYSPIIIYNTKQSFEPVYSVSCLHPTVEISPIFGMIDKSSDDFAIATLYGVRYFQAIEKKVKNVNTTQINCIELSNIQNQTNQNSNNTYKYGNFSPITCCTFLYMNENYKYLSGYDSCQEKIIITGHEKGQVMIWSTSYRTVLWELCNESCEIVNIIPSTSNVLIASNSSIVNFYDVDLRNKKRLFQIDLTTLDLQLKGYDLSGILERPRNSPDSLCRNFRESEYIIGTTKGDFFMLSLNQKQDSSLRYKLIGPRYQCAKLPKIISIGNISTHKLLQKQNQQNLLFYGGEDGVISIINATTHTITQTWKIGEPIISIDCLQFKEDIHIVVGTTSSKVYSSINFIERNTKYIAERPISCLKVIIDSGHVVLIQGLEGGYLHFINTQDSGDNRKGRSLSNEGMSRKIVPKNQQEQYNKGNVANLKVPNSNNMNVQENLLSKQNTIFKRIKLASTPTEIISLEKKMLLVSTQDNIFYLISLKDYFFKAIQPEKNPLSAFLIKNKCIKTYYCLQEVAKGSRKSDKKVTKIPVILGKNERLTIIANTDNTINIWRNLTDAIEQNRLKYSWHSSRCCNFTIDNDKYRLYSSGAKDGMIIQSELLKFYEHNRSVTDPSRTLVSAISMKSLANYNLNSENTEDGASNQGAMIEKQIEFCTFNNQITTEKYDQHILVRGLENQTLSRLFRGMNEQWKIMNKQLTVNSSPRISLKLDYVYGIETDSKRSTVFAISIPHTQFVYFISNLVIIYDPTTNSQKIYKGHRYKITCISKIMISKKQYAELTENKQSIGYNEIELIASAESYIRPVIKIWNSITLQTIRTLDTVHSWGIIDIFCNSQAVLSYGVFNKAQRIFSLELSEIKTGKSIASRQIKQLIYSMAISPLKSNEFTTTGKYNVTIWKAVSGNIEKFSVIQTNSTITCCIYRLVQYSDHSFNESDLKQNICENYSEQIIIGSENGELGLITGLSKYILIEEKAHQKSINCISYVNNCSKISQDPQFKNANENVDKHEIENSIQRLKNKNIKYIVTCSEDETLKIWSRNFKLEYEQDIRKIQFEERSSISHNNNPNMSNNPNSNQIYGNQKPNASNLSSIPTLILSNQKVLSKNMSVQSISAIYEKSKYDNELCLLLATRNGDILVMKDTDYTRRRTYEQHSRNGSKRHHEKKEQGSQYSIQDNLRNERRLRPSKSSSKGLKLNRKAVNPDQKSSFISKQSNGSKKKLRLNKRSSATKMTMFMRQNTRSIKDTDHQIEGDDQINQQKTTHNIIQTVKFVLYLRSHSSQISTSTRSTFVNKKQKGGKVLFSHHPRFDLIATIAEDQNLMFWDTERNVLILNRMLGYFAQPTALKFTKDGEILIIGYSDGRLMFLDSPISKSHQGKGDEKYVLPSLSVLMQNRNNCPVLSIEQSESGDHIAVSYNNKPSRMSNSSDSNSKSVENESAHICIFLNKSRDKIRGHASSKMQHNTLFQSVTTIPCQGDSIYTTQNNKYGMATRSMMFTQHQGKTYLLIYEQLTDVHSRNKLNCNKDGNYIIWDVNTSTMIANLDQISALNWKKISVPNSIYARYQMYGNLTLNQEYSINRTSSVNSNLLVPYLSTMVNLPNHLILGSINGDIHIVQSSCLQYEQMLDSYPRRKDMFVGKTYPAHCSEIYHMEFNQDRSLLYTSGLSDKCVLKWKIQGDFNMYSVKSPVSSQAHTQNYNILRDSHGTKLKPAFNTLGYSNNSPEKEEEFINQEQIDMFKQVPNLEQIQRMIEIYNEKHKSSWTSSSILDLTNSQFNQSSIQVLKNYRFVKNITDFVETIRVIDIIGRRAHDMRYNLWYDIKSRIIYSTGHAVVVLKQKSNENQIENILNQLKNKANQVENKKSILITTQRKRIEYRQFLHILNGNGAEPSQEITCTYLSEDRRFIYTGHNGLMASISIWDACTKIRLETIILNKIVSILMIRTSKDNSTAIVYGINQVKQAYLMLLCLITGSVLGIANFVHEQAWHIKDIAYYPSSNHKFVTCGINQTISWKLMGNQLIYGILSSASVATTEQHSISPGQSYTYANSSANKSVSICVTFLPKSWRVVTGCEDGNLIFWGENCIQRREHSDMVMVLKSCQPNILLSGSRDGNLLLWIQESNSSGLTICSRLNLRNDSVSIFKPHGTALGYGSNSNSNVNQIDRAISENQSNENKRKRTKQPSFTPTLATKNNQNMMGSKFTSSNKNTAQESFYQELSVQSIDIIKIFGQNNESEISSKQFQMEQRTKTPQRRNRNTTIDREISNDLLPHRNLNEKQDNAIQKKINSLQNFNPQKWRVLIGTTSGDVYQTTFSQESKNKINFDENSELIEAFHDNQIPKSFFFSKTDAEIYEITSKGYFCCRKINDSTVIFQENFNKETVEMIYSPKHDRFYIIFKTQVRTFQTLEKINPKEVYLTRLKPLANLELKQITHAQISANEKVLAVGITKSSDKSVNIELYDISKGEQIKYLLNLAMPANQYIEYIDFSKNNKVILIKLLSGKIIAQQTQRPQNYGYQLIPFTQWTNQGQELYDLNCKIRQRIQNLLANQRLQQGTISQSSIAYIKEVADNVFIVINDQGNVYAFNSEIQLIGQSSLKISDASIIKLSHSKKLLGIGSEIDRNITVFDIGLTQILKGYQ